ncbi:polyphosphate:AMP phosphotransferase [Methyloprofundus sp.]|uniref:polyphosphate:AMP phosphotransferase n=1 Tax=Methyloprofundus sp. TaxID=2020875 RepID=UPI003D09BE31
MFEIAELGYSVSKADYLEKVPDLRTQLLTIQQQLNRFNFSVIILISGVDGGGKGEVINLLNEWLDPRIMRTNAYDSPSDEELERPKFWRFWRTMPAKGTIGIYVGSWYSEPIAQRVHNDTEDTDLQRQLTQIKQLEQELADDGTLIIKCWLHLKKDQQKKRLKQLEKNPETSWQVTERDKKHLKMYDDFAKVAETVLKETSSAQNPWRIIDGSNIRYSSLTVGQHVLDKIKAHMQMHELQQSIPAPSQSPEIIHGNQLRILDSLDLSLELDKKEYTEQLNFYQGKLNKLARQAHQKKVSSVLVFEGWDAGGKGGAIRRLTRALDARNYQVIPIASPTDEEREQHYLWRFWRHMPRAGRITIYDRSWYGRVLVERVEGFATEQEWTRAYSEISNFEEALTNSGIVLLKFWLHIDPDEQLSRFKEREQISYKQHKITEEDYRNRDKWAEYSLAVNDMVAHTSSQTTPWVLVEANNKRYARIKVLKTYCAALEKALG